MSGGKTRSGAALAGVLIGHIVLGFVWLVVLVGAVFFTSSETGWVDLVLLLGALCWLGAAALIVIGWQSGSHGYWAVPIAWATVFSIAAVMAIAESVKSAGEPSGPPRPGTACPKPSARARNAQPQAAGPSRGASVIAFVSDRDGELQIYVMNADGGNQRRLTRNATGGMDPAWSPDGTKIAFTRPCSYGNGRYDWADEIFVMNADGSGQRNLTATQTSGETSPAWSPDGARIAFVKSVYTQGSGPGFGIFVMNADGSGQRVLARNASVFGHPTWSANGKQIAFAGIDLTIHVMNIDGSGQRRLTDTHADSEDPAWSLVANRIAFKRSFSDADDAIYTMSPRGGAQLRLTHEDAGTPAWAPSGTKLAFTSARDGGASEVYVMNADGSEQTRLTHNSATDTDPSWRPPPRRRRRG